MKKVYKKISLLLMALAIVAAGLAVAPANVSAAAKAKVPAKIHISTNNTSTHYWQSQAYKQITKWNPTTCKFETTTVEDKDGNSVLNKSAWVQYAAEVQFAAYGDKIKNLKTSDKSLKARLVYTYERQEKSTGTDTWSNSATIGFWATEEGTYTVKFDVVNSKGKKVSSHKIKVVVKDDYAFKSVKFGSKYLYTDNENAEYWSGITTASSGKFSVKMSKGYKLQKIVVYYNDYSKKGKDEDGDEADYTYVRKEIKNNKKLTLNKSPYLYQSNYNYKNDAGTYIYNSNSKRKDRFAKTYITVYYTDKYTKQISQENFWIYKYVNKF